MKKDGTGHDFTLSDIPEIDLFLLRYIKNFSGGEHKSFFKGQGFDLVGLREEQPGDKLSSIDWPQSSLNNYDPIMVREFEEDKNATIFIVADASLSTFCGTNGLSSSDIASRVIAMFGLSGVFFQDVTGLFFFDHEHKYGCLRPKAGKGQVVTCIKKYKERKFSLSVNSLAEVAKKILGQLTRTSTIPFVSDFLAGNPTEIINAIVGLKTKHDAFMVMIDQGFAFDLPQIVDGWVECVDVDSGQKMILSSRELSRLSEKVTKYQDELILMARDRGIEVIRVGRDKNESFIKMADFFFIRRTKRKVTP